MLKRKSAARPASARSTSIPDAPRGFSRRGFLQSSGLAGLALAGIGTAGRVAAQTADAATMLPSYHKTICQFCSVGCSIWAEVGNGVWTGQEPAFESPINQGTHCARAPRCVRSPWANGG